MKVKTSFFGPVRRPWPEQSRDVDIPEGSDIQALMELLGYTAEEMKRVAVVVNGKKERPSHPLNPNDDVRVVLLAGGG